MNKRMKEKHFLSLFILFIPLGIVLSVSFFMIYFYSYKMQNYLEYVHKKSLQEYIKFQKSQSELELSNLILLVDKSQKQLKPTMKKELVKEVSFAYNRAHKIYDTYRKKESLNAIKARIKDSLSNIKYTDDKAQIFITDYKQNSIVTGSQCIGKEGVVNYADADNRVIVLEEIQKAKRHEEGFIESRNSITGKKEIIFVKDLKIFDWFIGSNSNIEVKKKESQNKILNMIKNMPCEKSDFFAIIDQKKGLYFSTKLREILKKNSFKTLMQSITHKAEWHTIHNNYYYTSYYAPYNWYILSGIDSSAKELALIQEYTNAEAFLRTELTFFLKISLGVALFVFLVSLWFWVKINKMLQNA